MPGPWAIGFIGAGQMATALARGWIRTNLLNTAESVAADPVPAARDTFAKATHLKIVASNTEVAKASDVIVLAVKPQAMATALAELAPAITPRHLVISIAAGITLETLASALPAKTRLARVMPNTPCLVGASASGYSLGPATTPDDAETLATLMGAVGLAFSLPEQLLDAVTGLSGSGPAYVFVFIEALADGGVKVGLPREVALKLAAQTVLGAAKMVLETGTHPAALKDAVTSPGGTTIAGLLALENGAFRAATMNAVVKAAERARELGTAK